MALTGGISEVSGFENNLEYEDLAKFAVEDYNKKQNALLEYQKLVNVKEQVVSGTMYYLTFEASSGGQKKVYEAQVWEKPWMNFKEVHEFKVVGDVPSS